MAFAPAVITNFFEIGYGSSPVPIGATGGGYILSKGTTSRVSIVEDGRGGIFTTVNGDRNFDARTTRRAVNLFLSGTGCKPCTVRVEQSVRTPIGSGFGASGAAATSAVYATARAAGMTSSKRRLALFAHRAEILEQTGLGTVSVIFDEVGAGAISVPGEPGEANFVKVRVPRDLRIVTAFLAPFDKKAALSSKAVSERINELGHESLRSFLADPTLDTLAQEGERFSRSLGLESTEVKKLIAAAKAAGASYASQNMIGYSVHSLTDADGCRKVVAALRRFGREVRVDTFEIGRRRAGPYVPSRR